MRAENTFQSQSRADQLRQRRAQQSREHTATPRRTAARPSAPPVTVRSYQSSMATPYARPYQHVPSRLIILWARLARNCAAGAAVCRLGSRTILLSGGLDGPGIVCGSFSEEFQINSSKLMVSGIQRLTTVISTPHYD
jgi:hypothetical protein